MRTICRSGMKGLVRIRLVDKDGKLIKQFENHNFICDRFKDLIEEQSINMMFKPNLGTPYGMLYNPRNDEYTRNTSSGGWLTYGNLDNSFAVVLLNITEPQTPYDHTLDFIDIIDHTTGDADTTKITGYSVGRRTSAFAKEGILETKSSPDFMAPLNQVVNTFMFDLDKAIGSFNYIAIMPNPMQNAIKPLGFTFKMISDYDIRSSATDSFRRGYLMPGIKDTHGNVLTPDNTILTFENVNGTNKWFYNILTGEKTAVQPEDAAYNFNPANMNTDDGFGQQLVVGDYLYILQPSYNRLYKYNIADGSQVSNISLSATSYAYYKFMYYDGTNIIVTSYANSSSTSYYGRVATINLTNFTASYTNMESYAGLGGLPTSWNKRRIAFNKVGNDYIVYNDELGGCVVCSSLSDVMGTIKGVCDLPLNTYQLTDNSVVVIDQLQLPAVIIGAKSSSETTTYNFNPYSVCVAPFKYTNFWSLYKPDQAYTKTDSQKLFVDYGYVPIYNDSEETTPE